MGKWMIAVGIVAAFFLYDPAWAMQQLDHWVRFTRIW
jgi:hypothetical protein